MKFSHILLGLLMALLWSLSFAFVKAGTAHFPPFIMIFLRLTFVSLLLLPFYPKPPTALKNIAALAVFLTLLHIAPFFIAMRLGLDSSVAGILDQLQIIFTIILATILLKETLDIRTILGIVTAFIGVFFLFGVPNVFSNPIGVFFMALGGVGGALYNLFLKKIKYESVIGLVAWIALFSLPMLLPFILLLEDFKIELITTAPFSAWISVLYMAIGSSISAHGLWYYLVRHNPLCKVAPLSLLIPVISVINGWFFYDENITWQMLLGGSLMVIGVAIVIVRKTPPVEMDMEI